MEEINLKMKFVIIGDGSVGKTCFLYCYINKGFPKDYVPTVMDQYSVQIPFGENDTVKLEVWDTAGSDLFLVCYSCVNRSSFTNINTVWVTEVKDYPNVAMVLVGTKSDLLEEKENQKDFVKEQEAKDFAEMISADGSFQCSAMKNQGVQEVFKNAVKVVYDKRVEAAKPEPPKGCACLLL